MASWPSTGLGEEMRAGADIGDSAASVTVDGGIALGGADPEGGLPLIKTGAPIAEPAELSGLLPSLLLLAFPELPFPLTAASDA